MKAYNLKILSSGMYIPQEVITNFDLSKLVETSDEWITSRTGIKERRKAINEDTLELAYLSAMDAVNNANYDINKIDLIIVATITNEIKSPSIANLLQERLGLNNKHVMAFDINAACTGYIYALELAASLLNSGNYQSALVVGSEKMTNITDFKDRSTCILFGDAAGSLILENGEDKSYFFNNSKGDNKKVLEVDNYIKMNGPRVYQFATNIIPETVNHILTNSDTKLEEIDYFIPHQANKRIIDTMIKDLNLDLDKVIINIEKYGNTSAASIPVSICEYKKIKKGKNKLLLVGFGGGFTNGAAIINF